MKLVAFVDGFFDLFGRDGRDAVDEALAAHADRMEGAVRHFPADRGHAFERFSWKPEAVNPDLSRVEAARDVLHGCGEAKNFRNLDLDLFPAADDPHLPAVHDLLILVRALLRNAAKFCPSASDLEREAGVRQRFAADVGDTRCLARLLRGTDIRRREVDTDARTFDGNRSNRPVDRVHTVPHEENVSVLSPGFLAGFELAIHAVHDHAVVVMADAGARDGCLRRDLNLDERAEEGG